jgi:PAS domain S-box-containing protein
MKSIKLKLLIFVGIIVLTCSAMLFQRSYSSVTSNIENLTQQQLDLALNFDLAIREYVFETVRPIMFRLVSEDEFIPETMSTSYFARQVFEKVRKQFPDYIIKFASGNPRNPVNQAGPEELKMIRYFNDNPGNTVWTGEIDMGDREYLATFSAMRMEKACLQCHGNPADAPIELIKRYGSDASFYLPLGEVVGLDTIAIPSDTVAKLLLSEKFKNLGFLGAVILLLSASLIFVFKFVITDRLSKISNHFSDVEKQGDGLKIGGIEITGEDEIAGLAKNFNKLAERLNNTYIKLKTESEDREQAQNALRESEEKYRKLFEMESDALVLMDVETGNVLDANIAFVNLYGYTKEEILSKKNTDFTAEPDKTKKIIQSCKEYVPLVRHKKKNGKVFPVEITVNYFEHEGRKVLIAAIRDITDRRLIEQQIETSLKEKEVLLSEIHHRVKNNFEIISSLLDLSSMHTENQEMQNLLLNSRNRIHSMAMIHSQLYQSDQFGRVDMAKHINDLAEHLLLVYGSEKKVNLAIEPSEIYLSINQAIPCALIINELITNSLKYAFRDGVQGKIQISINNSDDNTVLLRVKDDGDSISGGMDLKDADGLGLEMVKHLVVGQLKGEIRFNHDDGTDICIEFKRLK